MFRFNADRDRTYLYTFYAKVTPSKLPTSLVIAMLQLRFVVPGGASDGSDFYFPFPEEGGYTDLFPVNLAASTQQAYMDTLSAGAPLRAGGCGVEVRLSAATSGTASLNSAYLIVRG
jgi:hypothetical protein